MVKFQYTALYTIDITVIDTYSNAPSYYSFLPPSNPIIQSNFQQYPTRKKQKKTKKKPKNFSNPTNTISHQTRPTPHTIQNMSTKGLRHHMVMNSHHHRWASRRTISAAQNLTSSHAVHVPVHKGKRILNKTKAQIQKKSGSGASVQNDDVLIGTDGQVRKKAFSIPDETSNQGRGSFDSFFASISSEHSQQSQSSFGTHHTQANTTAKTNSLKPSAYSPHLFTTLELTSNQLDQGLDESIRSKHPNGVVWVPGHDNIDTFVSPKDISLHPIHAYFADVGLPCGSVHNTISHLFAAEKLWQDRWTGRRPSAKLHNLWSSEYRSNELQWSQYCSEEFGLPVINLDNENEPNEGSLDTKFLLSMSLEEQDKLAQKMLSKISLNLDEQNSHWIELIQGTTEPDLYNELSYFDTSYKPSRRENYEPVSIDDFSIDKAKVQTMPKLVALNHIFMHATHHRSQILSTSGQFTGETIGVDLSLFVPEWKQIHSKVFRWA